MPFHDCGTFNVNKKTGGCNGSLRKELPETMPLQDLTTVSVAPSWLTAAADFKLVGLKCRSVA
jgi:hypothetical protein